MIKLKVAETQCLNSTLPFKRNFFYYFLLLATMFNDTAKCESLLKIGADPNIKDSYSETPLLYGIF